MSVETQPTKSERPIVHVSALTADTCEVVIFTAHGSIRLICSHEAIEFEGNGIAVVVRP